MRNNEGSPKTQAPKHMEYVHNASFWCGEEERQCEVIQAEW